MQKGVFKRFFIQRYNLAPLRPTSNQSRSSTGPICIVFNLRILHHKQFAATNLYDLPNVWAIIERKLPAYNKVVLCIKVKYLYNSNCGVHK